MRTKHHPSHWELMGFELLAGIALAILAVALSLGSLSRAAADEPDERALELHRELVALDGYRHGDPERMKQLEARGAELHKRFDRPAEKARIHFQVAHVYAQSDIRKHQERVKHFGKLVLSKELPIGDRTMLYSYLGSAEIVNEQGTTLPQRRAASAKWLLKGYHELLKENLPDVKPELPGVWRFDIGDDGKSPEENNAKIEHALQMAKRKEAERVSELCFHRDVMHDQISGLYANKPEAIAELRQLVKQEIGENDEIVEILIKPRIRFPEYDAQESF